MQRVSLTPALLALSLLTSGCLLNVDADAEQEFTDAINGASEDMSSGEGDMSSPDDMSDDMDITDDMPAGMTCEDVDEAEFCNGHGICEEEEDGLACSCEGEYSGKQCELCNAGFMRDSDGDCVTAQPCDDLDCGDRGTCILVNGTDPECACDDGYAGSDCGECDTDNGYVPGSGEAFVCVEGCGASAEPCSGHGTCDDSSGEISCACDAGYDGEDCSECADGYVDNNMDGVCVDDCGLDAQIACGPNSSCSLNSDDMIECTCVTGYEKNAQDRCTDCAQGYQLLTATGGMCTPLCEEANLNCPSPEVCIDPPGERARCEFFPATCPELQGTQAQPQRLDGFYELYFENNPEQPWVAYCKDQASSPSTYLPLSNTSGPSNAFTRIEGVQPYPPQMTTRYLMLRIEPQRTPAPVVRLDDTAFAKTVYFNRFQGGDPSPTELNGEFMLFGTVQTDADEQPLGGNIRATSRSSAASVDFRNTGFKPAAPVFRPYDNTKYCNPQMAGTGSVMMFGAGAAFALQVTEMSNLGPEVVQEHFGLRCDDPMFTEVAENTSIPLVMELSYSGGQVGSALTHPASCQEVQANADRQSMMASNGDYTLYVGWDPNQPWAAYCDEMNTAEPKTYLTLPTMGLGSNEFELIRGSGANQVSGTILYSRIEIDPYTLEVNIANKTHATISVPSIPKVEYPDYGTLEVSGDMNNAAVGQVNLLNTGFRLAQSPLRLSDGVGFGSIFGPQTCDAIVGETLLQNRQVADITLTVDPGRFEPALPTKASPNRRALFQGAPPSPCEATRPFIQRSSEEDHVLRLEYIP